MATVLLNLFRGRTSYWLAYLPTTKQKNQNSKHRLRFVSRSDFLVTPPGFEPRLAGPKPDVLPLHHEAITMLSSSTSTGVQI
jgi:hypothetical protein